MLTFKGFTGINNVQDEIRLKASDLLDAQNVDIGLNGEISRRDGYTQLSMECHRNLWQAPGFLLATTHEGLVSITDAGTQLLMAGVGGERVWYTDLPDGRVVFSMRHGRGITDGVTAWPLEVSAPQSLGAVDFAFGQLPVGMYRYGLTYTRDTDRAESPLQISEPVLLDKGGLRLDALPLRAGHSLNVYLSEHDGSQLYLAGTATTDVFEFTGQPSDLVLAARTQGAQALPDGTLVAFWRGRLLLAQGNVLWASRPMAQHLAEWRDFKALPAEITALCPVDNGIYVGTAHDLVFLGGDTFDGLQYSATQRGPVVLGSGVRAPGHQLMLGDGAGAGTAMVCIAGGEVVAGFNSGQTFSLTDNRYKSAAREVSAVFRVTKEIPQYVAVPHA